MQSNISFEEYSAWCMSRFPENGPVEAPESFSKTVPVSGTEESCPVTVRSARDCVVVTPRAKGSR